MAKHNGNSSKMNVLEKELQSLAQGIEALPEVGTVSVMGSRNNIKKFKQYKVYLLPVYTDAERKTQIGFDAILTTNGHSVGLRITPKALYEDTHKSMSALNHALVQYALQYRR